MTGHTTPIRRASAAAGLLLALSVSVPIQAEPTDKPKANRNSGRHSTKTKADQPDSDESKKDDGNKDVDTEHLFGFTEGADAGEKGEQEAVIDTVTRIGKRKGGPGPSTYRVLDTRFAYQFNPIDKLSIEFSAFGTLRRQRNVLDLDDKSYGTFDGASLEVKYQFLKGSKEQPLGLALEVRPRFTRILPVEGQGADIFDIESLLQLDVQVVPDTLAYCWRLMTEDTPLRGSVLEIEAVAVELRCAACGCTTSPADRWLLGCARCGSAEVTVTRGEELMVASMDLRGRSDG